MASDAEHMEGFVHSRGPPIVADLRTEHFSKPSSSISVRETVAVETAPEGCPAPTQSGRLNVTQLTGGRTLQPQAPLTR